jgi:hypothetical protein
MAKRRATEKSHTSKDRKPRKQTTPLTRLRRSGEQLTRVHRVLRSKFKAWQGSSDPQVAIGAGVVDELGKLAARMESVIVALEEADFVPPEVSQYKPPVEGEHVRIAPKYRDRYAEKCADQLKSCPTLFDDLMILKVFTTSRTVHVARSPFAPFEARRSHLVPLRRAAGDGSRG